jgi:hypothetical protein
VPNPIKEILDLKVGLRLSDSQEAKLTVISDSLTAKGAALGKELQAEIAKLGANVDGGRMMVVIRPRLEQARKDMQAALDSARTVLTQEQWNYLPDRIKNPRTFGGGPGGGGRRRPPGQ